MSENDDLSDVPVELLRTFVVTFESRDMAQAEQRLGRPRAAIRAEIDRLEQIVGCTLLSGPERRLSWNGMAILSYAQRLISVHDEMVRSTARVMHGRRLRIGLPLWLPEACLTDVIRSCTSSCKRESLDFRCDELEILMRDLNLGRLDLVFSCNPLGTSGIAAAVWTEPLYWIKSADASLRPNQPVNLVSWPGGMSDRVSTLLLGDAGLDYSTMFSGRAVAARVAAVAAGLGLMMVNERLVRPGVRVAREDHLPRPPQAKGGIYMREGFDADRYAPVLRALEASVKPRGLFADH